MSAATHAGADEHQLLVGHRGAHGLGQTRGQDPHEAVVVASTLDRAFARWCFTVECDRPSRWAAAFSDPESRTAVLPATRTFTSNEARAIATELGIDLGALGRDLQR
jgi:hypothetical protein